MNTANKTNNSDIVVPLSLSKFGNSKEQAVSEILFHYREFGINRFLLGGPKKGWRGEGYPPKEEFIRLAQLFLEIKNEVTPYGIECGWWLALTLKS